MITVKRGKAWSLLGAFATVALALSGCGKASTDEPSTDATQSSQTVTTPSSDTYFTTDEVHSIDIDLDQADYEAMLTTYAETGDKEWVTVTATIDGNTFEDVGLRLKGNSSLRTALATSRGIEKKTWRTRALTPATHPPMPQRLKPSRGSSVSTSMSMGRTTWDATTLWSEATTQNPL